MNAPLDAVRRLLESLGHEETVDSPESHSSVSRRGGAARVGQFEEALGWRRLFHFKCVHEKKLRGALALLEGAKADAQALAWRGRLQRLLGETDEARRSLRRSLALKKTAEAAAWLGELSIYSAPEEAEEFLAAASRLAPRWSLPHFWRGLVLLRRSRPEKAAAEFVLALRLEPRKNSHLLRLALCEAFLRTRDHARAFDEARRAIRLDPDSPAGYHMAGGVKFAAGDLEAATEFSHQARNRDINLEGPFFSHLGIVSNWDMPAAYLETLDRAIERSPRMAALYAARAELKRDPKLCLYEEALADYERAVSLAPECAWIRSVLARARDNSLGGKAGLKTFARAIALCPASGWVHSWRGAVWARLGESERALADFARALELMPWYSFTYAWRGALYNRLGRFQEALDDLDTAVRLDESYTFSYYERFQARRALKDDEGAIADLNRAFSRNPKYTWLGSRAAETDPKKRAELLVGLDAAIARSPGAAWLRAWRGYSLLEWSRPMEALEDLEEAAKLGLRCAEVVGWRGAAFFAAGRFKEAAACLKTSIRLNPNGWHAYKVLSEVYAANGKLREALAAIARAAELAPTTVPVLVSQARLEHRLGREDASLALLSRAAELDPRYPEIHILIAEIRLGRAETSLASSAVERALDLPRPSGKAYLIRGLIRQKLGDFKGQIADFSTALRIDPGLFKEKERRLIEDLVRRGERETHGE